MPFKPMTGLRNASGLALSAHCAAWFWLAYAALLAAVLGVLIGQLLWRSPDLLSFYFVEALLGLCAPLAVLLVCDSITLRVYGEVWYDLRDRGRALLLLDPQAVDTIRSELRWHPLLAWLRPPASRDVGSQLFSAALWYRALMAPEGASTRARYGEQYGWALAFGLLLAVPPAWFIAISQGLFESPAVNAAGTLLSALMFALFGLQQLVLLARRQAILDYFAVHREQAEPASGDRIGMA